MLRRSVERLLSIAQSVPRRAGPHDDGSAIDADTPTAVATDPATDGDAATPSAPDEPSVLDHPDRYDDLGPIAQGGMGEIRALHDPTLGREVAAKLLERSLAHHAVFVEGFIQEARITAQLEHPNIVPVHELGVDRGGRHYFTMKRVQGQTLHALLHDPGLQIGSPVRLTVALDIFLKTCDAVAFAHSRGVLHRDIKPSNIMVGAFGEVYLMDWGLAVLKSELPSRLVRPEDGRVGTPGFMAPEVVCLQRDRIDERADIFGLGAVLYQILTGQPPFGSGSADEIFARTATYQVTPPDQLPDILVSRKLSRVVMTAMARAPEDRHASAAQLAAQVREFLHRGLHQPQETFEPGQTIVREGEVGEKAYIITRGRCEVYKTVNGARTVLRSMGPGSLFGESAMLEAAPRTATVEAMTKVTVLTLSRDVLEDSFSHDTWEGLLVKTLIERFREIDARLTALGATEKLSDG